MANVAIPISSNEATNVSPCARLDYRSARTASPRPAGPRTPNRTSPATRQCGGWTGPGKEQLREYRHRSGGVDVEVVELDRGADHRCHRDAAARDVDDEVVGNRTHQ